jgi:putative membrane protein
MTVVLPVAVAGAVVASVVSLVPALHICNVAGFIILASDTLSEFAPPELLAMFFLGLITSHSMLNTIPSMFLSAPDDSTVFVVLRGRNIFSDDAGMRRWY